MLGTVLSTYNVLSHPFNSLVKSILTHPHFTDDETKAESLINVAKGNYWVVEPRF